MAVESARTGSRRSTALGGAQVSVEWFGRRPSWLALPEARDALDEEGVLESVELDRDLARRAAPSEETAAPTILHATAGSSRAGRMFREQGIYDALVIDLSTRQSLPGRGEARRLGEADLVLVGSVFALRETRRRYPFLATRTALFRPPVDLATHDAARERARSAAPTRSVMLFAGPLTAAGGLDLAVEALARLDADLEPPALVALPTPDEEKGYLAWCRRRAAEAGIQLTFAPPTLSVEDAFAAATLVCAPHRDPLGRETARRAAAAGVPIVGSEVEPLLELVEAGGSGYLVPIDDVAELTGMLALLLRDRGLRAELGRNAREFAEAELAPQRAVARLVELWSEAVRRRRRTPLLES
jgi:glycosyltransferase involved in cell wall biosynthesis